MSIEYIASPCFVLACYACYNFLLLHCLVSHSRTTSDISVNGKSVCESSIYIKQP